MKIITIALLLFFGFSCSVQHSSSTAESSVLVPVQPPFPQDAQGQQQPPNQALDAAKIQSALQRIDTMTSTQSLFATMTDADLRLYANAYQYIFVKSNGRYVIDQSTGLIKTQSRVFRGSYMRQSCSRLPESQFASWYVSQWAGIPLDLCQYSVTDTAGSRLKKNATVILLPISEALFADWIINTCTDVSQKNLNCIKTITNQALMQSGGQFIVKGVVYEDQYISSGGNGSDGYYEPYCFRDGVTVYTGMFNSATVYTTLSAQESNACFNGTFINADRKVGRYARIVGTSPESYVNLKGNSRGVIDTQGLTTVQWLNVSREETQAAYRNRKNTLVTIWAKSNSSLFRKP